MFAAVLLIALAISTWLLFSRVLDAEMSATLRWTVLAAGVASLPGADSVWSGQWDGLLLLPSVLALLCATTGRKFMAGLLLSMLLLKPQVVWLLPVVMTGAREWRILLGMLFGGLARVVAIFMIMGPADMLDYPRAVLSGPANSDTTATIGLPGLIGGLTSSLDAAWVVTAILAVGTAAFAWRYGHLLRGRSRLSIAIGLSASLAFTPHVWPWDLILLAAPFCVWARTAPLAAIATGITLSVLDFIYSLTRALLPLEVVAPLAVTIGLLITLRERSYISDANLPCSPRASPT